MNRSYDWHRFQTDQRHRPVVVDSRRRLGICLAAFLFSSAVVFGRVVQLEITQGAAFRAAAARPVERTVSLPGERGRILDRKGKVLACDRQSTALAVRYRWLQQPADPRWLDAMARHRLSPAQRKDARLVRRERERITAQRENLARRLAGLAGISTRQWNDRVARIQSRVERISATVNRRRQARSSRNPDATDPDDQSAWDRFGRLLVEVFSPPEEPSPVERVTVAEELDYHVVAEDVPPRVVAEVEGNAGRYPGVKIVAVRRRVYPAGPLASHVVGYLGAVGRKELTGGEDAASYHPQDRVGRQGVERQYETILRGARGEAVVRTDHGGRVLSRYRRREPAHGRDLVLTLDGRLQATAEDLLAAALARGSPSGPDVGDAGGAVVVMDARNGEILASASAPAFDPNVFSLGDQERIGRLLSDPADPLFNRATRMALPPGSVFKVVAAVALLESGGLRPGEPFFCRGYLRSPGARRCAIYRHTGRGHGETTLSDALCRSCNVYFFHHAGRLGSGRLVDWARCFGFGRPTGIDLPQEAAGTLPLPPYSRREIEGEWIDVEAETTAVGQGVVTATPLQVVRMMAAVANGGRLVTPWLARRLGSAESPPGDSQMPAAISSPQATGFPPPQPIRGLRPETLAALRDGLARVVSDPEGTAHGSVYLDSVAIAGKTGTAETGAAGRDHAWFAGYAPADEPRFAFVVVLEHGGRADETAGAVARRLVQRMDQLGYFDP